MCGATSKVGAAQDIRANGKYGSPLLLSACNGGHLDVAHWPYEVGAADDIWATADNGKAPLLSACDNCIPGVSGWLVLSSDANDLTTGHVDKVP